MTPVLNTHGLKDLKGLKFGTLLVLFKVVGKDAGKIRWRCQCVCGTRLTVRHDYLLHTHSPKRHCGCLAKGRNSIIKHHVSEYHIWKMMLVRCNNPGHKTYEHYGKRGIKVCERWHTFEHFLADMGPRPSKAHSLDRTDPNGNYEPGNHPSGIPRVRWESSKNQARNKRKSLFLLHPETGKTVPAAEVAEFLGLTYQQLRYQYRRDGKWPT